MTSDKAIAALGAFQSDRKDSKRSDIERAIRKMRKANAAINVSAVARKAGVARNTVYQHQDLVAVIDQYRQHDIPDDTPAPAATPESSILAGLRRTLAARDSEVAQLKRQLAEHESTIALLYGQLDDANSGRSPNLDE